MSDQLVCTCAIMGHVTVPAGIQVIGNWLDLDALLVRTNIPYSANALFRSAHCSINQSHVVLYCHQFTLTLR